MDTGAIAAFVAAAEERSFTAAARKLGITASGVSKAVQRLENELRVRLFNRTTRSISLTENGTVLYERCKQILNDLHDAKDEILQAQAVPSGRLRISVPSIFGRMQLIPAISAFLKRYPLVSVEASFTDRIVDLIDEAFDVVIRIGEPPDTRVVARPLTSTRFIVAGSDVYLAERQRPKRPEDLTDHTCVGFISPYTHKLMDWTFVDDGRSYVHPPNGNMALDSGEALVDAATNHVGLIYVQDYTVEREIRAGALRLLLSEFTPAPIPIVAMYPENRYLSPKVRAFIDFMVEDLAKSELSKIG